MTGVRGPAGGAHAPQQHALVPGVGDRVERLGQHRGGARDRGDHELRHRDRAVGDERGDDGETGTRTGHDAGVYGLSSSRRKASIVR